ncbi:MAG: hypothetical protein COB12_11290 [Flavobacterium sp.]|nr:MAG: hypothetical protein COB12_11290 [Flavobacterium sp.]
MNIFYKIIFLGILSLLVVSCGVNKVYTSASYGALKTYTEKPIYNGEKETAIYVSGSLRNTKYPQAIGDFEEVNDKVIGGNLSVHRAITNKNFNYYYGLGASFGSYEFNSDLINGSNTLENFINENDKLNYYNINLKAGVNLTKTWKRIEYSIIGLELLYVNEFGPYIDRLNSLAPLVPSSVIIANEESIFAFNLNTEVTFRINKDNNIGVGIFAGSVLFNDKDKIKNETPLFSGGSLKYNYKDFTISVIGENSRIDIVSMRFGITYKIVNKSKEKAKSEEKSD